MRKILVLLTATALLSSGCALATGQQDDSSNVVLISASERSDPITISGMTLEGVNLSTTTLDGMVVVNAWASWCRTCILEWRDLQEVALANPNVSFLGLNESDSKQAALKFLDSNPTNYQHIFDPNNEILNDIKDLPSLAIPITLLLDNKHRVAARIMGRAHSADLQKIINALADE